MRLQRRRPSAATARDPRPRSARPVLTGLVVGALLTGAGVAVGVTSMVTSARSPGPPAAGPAIAGPGGSSGSVTAEPDPGPGAAPACAAMVAALPVRDRLAQRLMVGVDAADPRTVARTVRDNQVGGVFVPGTATVLLRGGGLAAMQSAARLPVAVAVDDEGGRVQRIDDLDGPIPSARRMAATMTVEQVRALGRARGRQLLARGITMNFAPDVDVSDQASNEVIGDRSFSDDPAVVSRYSAAFAEGQREAGVFEVLKHFPGHGHGDGDSHLGRVATPPLDELRRDDLRPYADLLGPGGPLAGGGVGVMVGHLDVPGLTDGLPSSLTPAVYRLLRDDYGFDGLVITDDLGGMKAITGRLGTAQATVTALQSGADMALSASVGPAGSTAALLDALERALAAGRLDPAGNDRAVARILAAKGLCTAPS